MNKSNLVYDTITLTASTTEFKQSLEYGRHAVQCCLFLTITTSSAQENKNTLDAIIVIVLLDKFIYVYAIPVTLTKNSQVVFS